MRLNFFLKPIYSVFGIGYIKIGSGTFCSLLPCLIILFFGGNLGLFARLSILIIILIFGAMLTPPDPFSQIVMALPLVGLYEISILISGVVKKTYK